MFTKLLIAASTLVLIAYGMEPDKYGAQQHDGAQQHAAVSSMRAVSYRA
jgi:hypothetical protein